MLFYFSACNALRTCLPQQLVDGTFDSLLENDMATKRWLTQLIRQISIRVNGLTNGANSVTTSSIESNERTCFSSSGASHSCLPTSTSIATISNLLNVSNTTQTTTTVSVSNTMSSALVGNSNTQVSMAGGSTFDTESLA